MLSLISNKYSLSIKNSILLYGLLQEDMTLTADKEYLVSDDLVIGEGYTLTINPGVTLKISDNTKIRVTGNIYAVGTPLLPIYFLPENNYWEGFDVPGNSIFRYCHFQSIMGYPILGVYLK